MARVATAAAPQAISTPRDRRAIVTWSDAQLLRQFLSATDESAETAFVTLIERYGPIVHRVCLDVLRDREEAQDAAQAVFLVLARKAGSIRKPEALGPWLHGVALRVAQRARSEEARRRTVERRKAEIMYQSQTQDGRPDLLGHAELHEEVDRLPEKYRQPIILCYMQGRTQVEAAEALGWPLGTVQVRLHRGRERLRSSLTRRGVGALAVVGTGQAMSLSATAAMPGREWTQATAAAAVRFAGGRGTAGLVAPVVTRMAESALTAMFYNALKIAGLVALAFFLPTTAFLLIGPSKRAVAVTAQSASPEPAKVGVVAPAMPKSSRRKTSTAAVVETVQAVGLLANDQHELDERRSPRYTLASLDRSDDSAPNDRQSREAPNKGRELFERVWVKDDRRSHGGDGLGPVFNGMSCVVCHQLGGPGGAGGVERNIEIASATEQFNDGSGYFYSFSMDFGSGRFDYRLSNAPETSSSSTRRIDPRILSAIHPGFREARSVVLHHFGTDPAYLTWRASMPGQHGSVMVRISERNPPALFGVGLIDDIPDEVIEAAAKRKFPSSSSVKGRVSRLKDGRIGRFGWKAQTATLKEFVISAAAGEMGLEVPGQHQAADPRLPGLEATGLDMDEAECNALTNYVRGLSAPIAIEPADDQESAQFKSGEETFKAIGCAHCHLPKLGGIEGIYSDLLLHDMSSKLGDADTYSVFVGGATRADAAPAPDRPGAGPASIQEWRTPPLWGLRDSAPYLHDGRAATIDEAIALHAGQGASSARRHAELSPRRKRHLAAFLRSLAAPSAKP
jgi:RNA polymerase sigma factor (sigma-70 family)